MFEKMVASYSKKENEKISKNIELKKDLLPESITIERDVMYEIDDEKQGSINIYYPNSGEKNLPVIINIHGGGMVCGFKEQNDLFCAKVAENGYQVYAIEYPLLPEVTIYEIYKVLVKGINEVKRLIEIHEGDSERVFLTGDSAGAYLATNIAIMSKKDDMREVMNVPEIELEFKALGLISGMFYVNKKDKIGMTLPKLMFGKGYKKTPVYEYTDLEKPELLECLPPSFFVTSHSDMLKFHTIRFAKSFRGIGKRFSFRCFEKDKRLVHAFVALYPEYPESEAAIQGMLSFFSKIE